MSLGVKKLWYDAIVPTRGSDGDGAVGYDLYSSEATTVPCQAALTFIIPTVRVIKTRAFSDPAQYDTEINAARGFKPPTSSKSKKIKHTIRVEDGVIYDPDQFDTEENLKRRIVTKNKSSW